MHATTAHHQSSAAASPPASCHDSDASYHNAYHNKDQQERFLPIANVSRIMKKSLPPNAKVSKEAKEAVQECVSEFISFITGEASDKCIKEKRKTINGDDLLWAMTTLGFDTYVGPLKAYLARYREVEGDRTSAAVEEAQGEHHSPTSNDHNNIVNCGNTIQQTTLSMPITDYFLHPSTIHHQAVAMDGRACFSYGQDDQIEMSRMNIAGVIEDAAALVPDHHNYHLSW